MIPNPIKKPADTKIEELKNKIKKIYEEQDKYKTKQQKIALKGYLKTSVS